MNKNTNDEVSDQGHDLDSTESQEDKTADLTQQKYVGCLVGGAAGDALGAPVEFWSTAKIHKRFGASGIQEYIPAFGKLGAITDDTQMTLFTAEGLLRSRFAPCKPSTAELRVYIAEAYQRWYHTQGCEHPLQENVCNGWLLDQLELFACRAPGNTCMSGLGQMNRTTDLASNGSKGCGGVMRVAPVGMYFASLSRHYPGEHQRLLRHAFELGCQAAAITHGHPTGRLSSGVFSAIIMELLCGTSLLGAIDAVVPMLKEQASFGETLQAVEVAVRLAEERPHEPLALPLLGAGWVADEALAIALYSALSAKDFRSGVELSVNHSGDSDSTGSMTGQLLGAIYGDAAIPATWLEPLELVNVIATIADDLMLGDWASAEVEIAAAIERPDVAAKTLTETSALRAYAQMVNSMRPEVLEPLLAEDFVSESQRMFTPIETKQGYLTWVRELMGRLKESDEIVYAEMGRVWCPTSIMCSPSIEAANEVSKWDSGNGNIRPCVLLAHGDKDAPEVLVLAEIEGNQLKRLDACVIPGPESAQRSGEYPK